MSFWSVLRGHIDAHQMTQKDISIIKSKLKVEGMLLRMLPLLNDPKAVPRSGVEIAKDIHSTPAILGIGTHASGYMSFELISVGEKVAMHLWAKDEHRVKRIRNQYKVSYPGMSFESCDGDYFLPLVAGEYCVAIRLDYQKDWIYPLEIVETERGWNSVLGACTPDETDQKLMIQILLDPVPQHKTRRGHKIYAKRTRLPDPNQPPHTRSENYIRLSEAIAHEANLPHLRMEIRVVVFGKDPHLIEVTASNIAGAFGRFSSTIGGNKLIPKVYNLMWRRAVISILNRDIRTFSTSWWHRMLVSTEELGLNFLTVPIRGANPLKYTKTEKIEDVTKLRVSNEEKKVVLHMPIGSAVIPPPAKDTSIKMVVKQNLADNTITVSDANLPIKKELKIPVPQPLPPTETPQKPPETTREPQAVQPMMQQEPTLPPTIMMKRAKLDDYGGVSDQGEEVEKTEKEGKAAPDKEEAKEKATTERILEHFEKNPQIQSNVEIAKALGVGTEDIKMQLSRLVKRKKIKAVGRGVYSNIKYKYK